VGRHLLATLAQDMPQAEVFSERFDICDELATNNAVRTFQPNVCVHLAAIAAIPVAQTDPARAWLTNVTGTAFLVRALVRHVPECIFGFASTADAYGATFALGRPLNEDDPLAPINAYGETKAAAEQEVLEADRRGLRTVRIRAFNHIGPGQSAGFAVGTFARQLARMSLGMQEPVIEVGNLDAYRDFLDVRDVCRAYVRCIQKATTEAMDREECLCLASGHPRRIGDVLADLIAASGTSPAIRQDSRRMRASDIPFAAGNASRAWHVLGWKPVIPWEKTMSDVMADAVAREAASLSSHP
jgi:GDP-4-dehydro-6-deoxy-D-mannose reductase